ncbi:MAG: anaerobic ribonucleoside-triphosphate reductase [Candidatus Bathyarchaeia archaeon]
MSVQQRTMGAKILKAVASPQRLHILNLLFDKGPLSYTELMSSLKMNLTRDAGKFAYHLKFLLKTDLIETDVETKKYCLTELGRTVIDLADRIEKKALKPKTMLVRTSRFALEEFDANKIANSLMKETKMPAELAQKIAKETEKHLLKAKTKYITAPLIREVVNAILIEKGLEEYRHKLTRLGLPVHDITVLIETKSRNLQGATAVQQTAAETVLKEYNLLNVFPRDIADAHLSGAVHIKHLSAWTLKPNDVVHDIRFFLKHGLNLEKIRFTQHSFPPPKNFESALTLLFNVLLHTTKEVTETQTLEYLNIFLAPYVNKQDVEKIKENLRVFVQNISQHADVTISLETAMPDFIAEKPAIAPYGKAVGKYKDFSEESLLLTRLFLEVFAEENKEKPLPNPKLILKIRPETFTDENSKATLLLAHETAAEKGTVYFANLMEKTQNQTVFSSSGCKINADLNQDWETDTLRVGCLGQTAINLPRIIYEAEKDKRKILEILKERLEMATRAQEIKYRMIKQNGVGLLPFLTQSANGDQYLRLENCIRIINLAGLKEAAEAFQGKSVTEDEKTLELVEELVQTISAFMQKAGRKRGRRLYSAMLPDFEAAERLAVWDIEKYGVAKVRFSGTREKPFYSTATKLMLQEGKIPLEALKFARKAQALCAGGSLTVIELGQMETKPEELMTLTRQMMEAHKIDFLAYNRKLSYCTNCKKSWSGVSHKCPLCGATATLTHFDRFAVT